MNHDTAPVYLDCNATAPITDAARAAVLAWLDPTRPANAGSRTHVYGAAALKAVNRAREQIASAGGVAPSGVVFTSGATEATNLAFSALGVLGGAAAPRHVVTSAIEHKAVLEPLERSGCEVSLVSPSATGAIDPDELFSHVREDTALISIMQVNNETGMIQPIEAIADRLDGHDALLHVDAVQGFVKISSPFDHPRVDLASVSGHKIGGPSGVGALLFRKRKYRAPALAPLVVGGGQERGLRAGTLPTMLVAGFGAAAEALGAERERWWDSCSEYRKDVLAGIDALPGESVLNMAPDRALPNCVNVSLRDDRGRYLDGEAVLLVWKTLLAASNGSACTSAGSAPSHVLTAQGFDDARVRGAVRLSWTSSTPAVDWRAAGEALSRLF